jgi:hypothetical protein
MWIQSSEELEVRVRREEKEEDAGAGLEGSER